MMVTCSHHSSRSSLLTRIKARPDPHCSYRSLWKVTSCWSPAPWFMYHCCFFICPSFWSHQNWPSLRAKEVALFDDDNSPHDERASIVPIVNSVSLLFLNSLKNSRAYWSTLNPAIQTYICTTQRSEHGITRSQSSRWLHHRHGRRRHQSSRWRRNPRHHTLCSSPRSSYRPIQRFQQPGRYWFGWCSR